MKTYHTPIGLQKTLMKGKNEGFSKALFLEFLKVLKHLNGADMEYLVPAAVAAAIKDWPNFNSSIANSIVDRMLYNPILFLSIRDFRHFVKMIKDELGIGVKESLKISKEIKNTSTKIPTKPLRLKEDQVSDFRSNTGLINKYMHELKHGVINTKEFIKKIDSLEANTAVKVWAFVRAYDFVKIINTEEITKWFIEKGIIDRLPSFFRGKTYTDYMNKKMGEVSTKMKDAGKRLKLKEDSLNEMVMSKKSLDEIQKHFTFNIIDLFTAFPDLKSEISNYVRTADRIEGIKEYLHRRALHKERLDAAIYKNKFPVKWAKEQSKKIKGEASKIKATPFKLTS
jgi:hypothetical protein